MIYEHPHMVSNAALDAGIYMTEMHRSMKDVVLSSSLNELEKVLNEINKHEVGVHNADAIPNQWVPNSS